MTSRIASLLVVLSSLVLCRAAAAQVVINEVDTGNSVDYVEIANLGGAAVDVSGWHMIFHEDTGLVLGATFVFPGAPGSGTVVLQPDECLVVTDNSSTVLPVVPPGTQSIYCGFNVPWNAGEAGSLLLADADGNGIDYFAHGNPNLFLAPLQAATLLGLPNPTPSLTNWSGDAAPLPFLVNTGDVFVRHGRIDTDTAADFTMLPDGDGSPGELNAFQATSDVDGLPPQAQIGASVTSGFSPLSVWFTNASTGDCGPATSLWDFDAANPGTVTSTDRNVIHVFTTPPGTPPGGAVTFDVTLTVNDGCGQGSTTLPLTITVIEPDPVVPQSIGLVETFEGPPSSNGTAAAPSRGWDLRLLDPTSRIRTVDPRNFNPPPGYADATLASGPTVLVLDSSVQSNFSTAEAILHLDGDAIAAQTGSGEFRVRVWLYDRLDESDPEDVIAFQDGFTAGTAVEASGASLATPGVDGFREVFLGDWHDLVDGTDVWTEVEFVFDAAFFAANPGLATPGSGNAGDYRIIFRHRDNFDLSGGDGLLIDSVRVYGPVTPGPGEPGIAGVARFDLNDATNGNGNPVGTAGDENGPFSTTATPGFPLVFRLEGEPNQPVLLIAGQLNPGAASYPVGQLDIGGAIDPMTGLPSGISVLVDGSVPDLFSSLFNTTPLGVQTIQFTTPAFPPGFTTTVQAAVYNSVSVIRLSNAVTFQIL